MQSANYIIFKYIQSNILVMFHCIKEWNLPGTLRKFA